MGTILLHWKADEKPNNLCFIDGQQRLISSAVLHRLLKKYFQYMLNSLFAQWLISSEWNWQCKTGLL